tara:strand:- start:319 stop:855 length:537 start_codon:yes stop_codon:yes gene_type:complete
MKHKAIQTYMFLSAIKDHKKHNKKILKYMEEMNAPVRQNSEELISASDWKVSKNTKRKYLDYFYKLIPPHMDAICKKLKLTEWNTTNGWFQKYGPGDYHSWHVHPESNWANVYYIQDGGPQTETQLYDPILNQTYAIPMEEGQVLTFPANIIHQSPLNRGVKTKIVISFNSNFWNYEV